MNSKEKAELKPAVIGPKSPEATSYLLTGSLWPSLGAGPWDATPPSPE